MDFPDITTALDVKLMEMRADAVLDLTSIEDEEDFI